VVSELRQYSDEYERAESAFMDAVRAGLDRDRLAAAAREVATAAAQLNSASYKALQTGVQGEWMPLDQLTERTEVLAELWLDLATAFEA
jgi:hypothetical protein